MKAIELMVEIEIKSWEQKVFTTVESNDMKQNVFYRSEHSRQLIGHKKITEKDIDRRSTLYVH